MKIEELHLHFKNSTGVSIDTRTVAKGNLFFALKGDNFNGNQYAKNALESGAKYAVVDDPSISDPNFILVEDCLSTLQNLASFHRESLRDKLLVFALSGSNGKTTTKELIYSVLKTKFKVSATIGNLNNHIGVPLTLLRIREEDEIAIVEMGANHQREIEFLSNLSKPDIGYITNFGKAHLEGFGGIEGVIKGKSELYKFLGENQGLTLVNLEDPIQMKLTEGMSRILFGKNPEKKPDFLIEEFFSSDRSDPFVSAALGPDTIQTNLTGQYNFNNISAAIALGLHLNISPEKIKTALEAYLPSNNRSQIENTDNNKLIIDAYNANPSSMEGAIYNLGQIKASHKWMILGDMFEMGKYEAAEHQKIVDLAGSQNYEQVIFVGKAFSNCKKDFSHSLSFISTDEVLIYLKEQNPKGKTILIKGSRGMKLERCIPLL